MLLLSPILIKIQTKQKCKTFLEMIFMTDMKLRKLVLAALFAALCTVMTMVIQVPSPMQGYVNLYGVITASNRASIAMHERLGYRQIGLHERTGWKFGQWHDVAWLHKRVGEGEPGPILPLAALDRAQVAREIAAAQREIEEKLKM